MLLLNLVRTLIAAVALGLIYTFKVAYQLEGIPFFGICAVFIFLALVISEWADNALVEAFNREP